MLVTLTVPLYELWCLCRDRHPLPRVGNKYESPSALDHLSRLQSAYNVVGDGLLADNYGRRKYAADSIDLEAIDLDSGDGEGMHSRLDRSMAAEPHLWMALAETPERRFRSHEVYEDFPEIDIQDEDFWAGKISNGKSIVPDTSLYPINRLCSELLLEIQVVRDAQA